MRVHPSRQRCCLQRWREQPTSQSVAARPSLLTTIAIPARAQRLHAAGLLMKRGLEDGDSVEVRDTVHRTQSAQASTSSTTVASSSASPDLGSGVKLARTDSISMSSACPHLSAAFTSLQPPRPSQQVHREECTLCFDDQVRDRVGGKATGVDRVWSVSTGRI